MAPLFPIAGPPRPPEPGPCPSFLPHKTKPTLEARVVALRRKTPGFGARRLIAEFDLPMGHVAVQRTLRDHQLTRTPKRRQNDLRAIKAAYATFAAERFLQHLKSHGLDTSEIIITTDLGSEFDGGTVDDRPEGFHLTIEQRHGARHRFNPPSCPNANADVESVHHTIEGEFFDAQAFDSRADFFAKISTYQLCYNVARKNGSRGYLSPLACSPGKTRTAKKDLPQDLLAPPHPSGVSSPHIKGSRCNPARRR